MGGGVENLLKRFKIYMPFAIANGDFGLREQFVYFIKYLI